VDGGRIWDTTWIMNSPDKTRQSTGTGYGSRVLNNPGSPQSRPELLRVAVLALLAASLIHGLQIGPDWRARTDDVALAAVTLSVVAASPDIHQLGPAVQIAVPNGRVSLELLKRLRDTRPDLRVTFQAYL
jgi:hypothetical protein